LILKKGRREPGKKEFGGGAGKGLKKRRVVKNNGSDVAVYLTL
jgi:hypothetical protein